MPILNNSKNQEDYLEHLLAKITDFENTISNEAMMNYMYSEKIWSYNYTKKENEGQSNKYSLFPTDKIEIEFRYFFLFMYFQEKCSTANIQRYLKRIPLICIYLKTHCPNCLSLVDLSEDDINGWYNYSEVSGEKCNVFKNFLGRVQQRLKVEYFNLVDSKDFKYFLESSINMNEEKKLIDSITFLSYFNSISEGGGQPIATLYVNNFWNLNKENFKNILLYEFDEQVNTASLKKLVFFHPNATTRLEFKSLVYFILLTAPSENTLKVINLFVKKFQIYLIKEFPDNMRIRDLSNENFSLFEDYCKEIGYTTHIVAKNLINHLNNWKFVLFELPKLTAESYCRKYDVWRSTTLRNYFQIDMLSDSSGNIDFNTVLDQTIKPYLKDYLIKLFIYDKKSFSCSKNHLIRILKILSFETSKQPFSSLSDNHFVKVIKLFSNDFETHKKSGSQKREFNATLSSMRQFLSYLNKYETFDIGVEKIFSSDNFLNVSFSKSGEDTTIKYIDEKALESILLNLHNFDSPYSEIIFLAFYTGQRLNDILSLKSEDVYSENGEYYLLMDISKTKVKRHFVPLPKEFGKYLFKYTEKKYSKFLFQSTQDYRRRNFPLDSHTVRAHFKKWVVEYEIKNNDGSPFLLSIHSFRHTFAVRMINSGTDFVTVSNFLAHISPEMTLHYAKKLDETKFQQFKKDFEPMLSSNNTFETVEGSKDKAVLIQSLYHSEKNKVVRTPYGTCFASKNNKCPFIDAPPCLVNDNGSQCNHLKIDQSYLKKYKLLKNELLSTITQARELNRLDIVQKSEQLLTIYTKIINDIEISSNGEVKDEFT